MGKEYVHLRFTKDESVGIKMGGELEKHLQ